MTQRLVYFNGDFIPEIEARISIFDCALMYGDMVFEMTRTFQQKPYRLRQHLERLYGSLDYVQIDCGLSIEEMKAATVETIERNLPALEGYDVQIMHDVTRGANELHHDDDAAFRDAAHPRGHPARQGHRHGRRSDDVLFHAQRRESRLL